MRHSWRATDAARRRRSTEHRPHPDRSDRRHDSSASGGQGELVPDQSSRREPRARRARTSRSSSSPFVASTSSDANARWRTRDHVAALQRTGLERPGRSPDVRHRRRRGCPRSCRPAVEHRRGARWSDRSASSGAEHRRVDGGSVVVRSVSPLGQQATTETATTATHSEPPRTSRAQRRPLMSRCRSGSRTRAPCRRGPRRRCRRAPTCGRPIAAP